MVVGTARDEVTGKLFKVVGFVLKDYRFAMVEIAIE